MNIGFLFTWVNTEQWNFWLVDKHMFNFIKEKLSEWIVKTITIDNLFLAVLGLRCCVGFLVPGARASVVAALGSCGAQA